MASFWDWVPTVIEAGVSLWGSSKASSANDKATQAAIDAQNRATKAQTDALQLAEQKQKEMQLAASPGLMQTQQIIARGEALTPEQKLALDDARRQGIDALQGGSIRGSARATTAVLNDLENRMRTGFMGQNRDRADAAASSLTGQYFNAGNNVSNLTGQQGQVLSSGLMNNGQNLVNSIQNDAAIKGTAIGDIGAVIADQLKTIQNQKRASSYDQVDSGTSLYGDRRAAI